MWTVAWGQRLPISLTSVAWPIALDRQQTWRRALELTLTNRTLTAQEALDWGIVTTVTPEGEALRSADELTSQLAQGQRWPMAPPSGCSTRDGAKAWRRR